MTMKNLTGLLCLATAFLVFTSGYSMNTCDEDYGSFKKETGPFVTIMIGEDNSEFSGTLGDENFFIRLSDDREAVIDVKKALTKRYRRTLKKAIETFLEKDSSFEDITITLKNKNKIIFSKTINTDYLMANDVGKTIKEIFEQIANLEDDETKYEGSTKIEKCSKVLGLFTCGVALVSIFMIISGVWLLSTKPPIFKRYNVLTMILVNTIFDLPVVGALLCFCLCIGIEENPDKKRLKELVKKLKKIIDPQSEPLEYYEEATE
jgi:hypothetical protein